MGAGQSSRSERIIDDAPAAENVAGQAPVPPQAHMPAPLPKGWPHRSRSRLVGLNRQSVHVQMWGAGKTLLFLHGAGASGHSWHPVMELLGQEYQVVVFDLPGHGFTKTSAGFAVSIENVAQSTGALIDALDLDPHLIIGHSAGAAIALHGLSTDILSSNGFVAINGAFMPFPGAAGFLFPLFAKLLRLNPFVPHLFAGLGAKTDRIERLVRETGSATDIPTLDQYQYLLAQPSHVAGALRMMANWDLRPLMGLARDCAVPSLFVCGQADKAVAPEESRIAARTVLHGELSELPDLGHLAHEEEPSLVSALIKSFAQSVAE